MRFVALSSSKGTTLQAVLERINDGSLTAQCLGLITDRPDRGCIAKAKARSLPIVIVERHKGENREEYDQRLEEGIRTLGSPDIVACLGWMWLFSGAFVRKWRRLLLNVHPSLLPKFPGAHAHEEVLKAEESVSGMTIHWIDEGTDMGEILLQKQCPVLPGDTVETLKERVQELEKEWYPKVLQMIEEGRMGYG